MQNRQQKHSILFMLFSVAGLLLSACSAQTDTQEKIPSEEALYASGEQLQLPQLQAIKLEGTPLNVVASNSIIGDVVAQVGGDAIALTTLIQAGQDPHSYQPQAQELTAVANADIIFINGWNLEETLVTTLQTIGEDAPLVPISAKITPLAFAEEKHESQEKEHPAADPHVWLDIDNVKQWVKNVEQTLTDLDPDNGEIYTRNAQTYLAELDTLQTETQTKLADIPAENRFLVSNHDAFNYFAQAYAFEIIGTVIPSSSTLAEPSARDLSELVKTMNEYNVCTIFTETTANNSLAQTITAELDACEDVQVLQLYSGALGADGTDTDSYIGMFRANVDTISAGLK